ncbi:MAG TPA: 16S rRNA (adenine(1518)-N(6)/adenine(1519)-N(6))-dimethyltransferase RsmA [Candidatus Baltobacteraceae bacterium]
MDAGTASKIARLIIENPSDCPGDFRVLEIGAGTGALSVALRMLHEDVTVLELDEDLIRILRDRVELAGVSIEHADALTFDYAAFARQGSWRMAGNLPYNVATPLITKFAEMDGGPQTVVAMIQKDVADRLVAKPSTPAYGSLSVAVQYMMRVERAFTLGPNAFYPRPKVQSTVVRLVRRQTPLAPVLDLARFRQVVRGAFAYRRKTLANSLTLALGVRRADVAHCLESIGIDPEIRGEQLSIADFARLADALAS